VIVYVYPADTFGCGFYRLIAVSTFLRAQGYDIRVTLPGPGSRGIGGDIDSATGELKDIIVPPDADVIVMQRVSLAHLSRGVAMMRAKGVAVVVDMDDDLTKIDPSNPAFWAMHVNGGDKRHNWNNAHRACLNATLVTVSTPALLKVYAPHGRGVVLDNYVPAAYLDIPHVDSSVVSWAGSTHSHPTDLQQVGPAIARLAREGITYRGVGPAEGLREALGLDADPPATGSVDIERWPYEVARIGIGIAPLADTGFNAGKSRLKAIEMMACGVPWVASPRAEYARVQRASGVGFLAKTPKDWYRHLKRLAADEVLREEQSLAGREWMRDQTIEANAYRWLEAWTHAYDLQRHAPVSVG